MNDHPAIRSREGNVVFLRQGSRAFGHPAGVQCCSSCLDWSGEAGSSGRCLADCGARVTPARGGCGSWRRPALTLVR